MLIAFNDYVICSLDSSKSDEVFDLINENRTRLENYFAGTVSETQTKQLTKTFCEDVDMRRAKKEYFPYVIIDSGTSKFIGWIDVKNIDWKIPKAEFRIFH